jgi:hypothetical protein
MLTNNKIDNDDEKETPDDYDNDFIDDETPEHDERNIDDFGAAVDN